MHVTCYNVTCAEGLGQSRACSLVNGLVSVSPYGPRLVDSVLVSLTALVPSIPLSLVPQDSFFCRIFQALPNVWLWVSSLHLFPLVAG